MGRKCGELGRGHQRDETQLFVVWTRILWGILKDMRWACGETAMCEDACCDFGRVDLREGWEATRTKVRTGFELRGEGGEEGGAAGGQ
jgi:hypothetical protein